MSKDTNDLTPDLARRSLGLGVLGLLGAGLASKTAEAFPASASGEFNAATRILSRYGVKVTGDSSSGHDVLSFDTQPLANTEYRQVTPGIETKVLGDTAQFTHIHPGEIIPCVRTTIEPTLGTTELFDEDQGGATPCYRLEAQMLEGGHIGDITATHFHPASSGEAVPCYKTTIQGHALAVTEAFDAGWNGSKSGLPALTLSAQMLDGARIGAVGLDVRNAGADLAIQVGGSTWRLVGGELVKDEGAVLVGA